MDLQLKGKKALVLGSSQGIGEAVAKSLIDEGCEVCLNSRSEENLRKTAEKIGAQKYLTCDLTQKGEASQMAKTLINDWGHVDILVGNAGGPLKNDFLDVTVEQWENDFQSLWMSLVEIMHVFIPKMKENKYGRLLFVTSIAAKEPLKGLTTSNGLRAGLNGLSKSLSHEYAQFGITSNVIMPGYTNTDRLKQLKLGDDVIKSLVPAGRLGEPNELADFATFLASPRASYITGQSIAVDGGSLMGH